MKRAFWSFWLTPADPTPLAWFRIGAALVGLAQLAVLWPHLDSLYGNFGLVQWVIMESGTGELLPGLGRLALATRHLGLGVDATLHLVFALYGVSLVAVLLGFRARLFAFLALAAHVLTTNSGYLSLYGVDTMLHVVLFYLCFVPASGTLSVDAWRGVATGEPSVAARIGLRTLQLHLCVIYLDAGFSKAVGEQWWTGEALWRALMLPQFAQFDLSWLSAHPWLLALGCWATLLIECGYAVAVWFPRVRTPWVLSLLALHAGIGVFMGLWLFSAMMIVLNVTLFLSGAAVPRAELSVAVREPRAP